MTGPDLEQLPTWLPKPPALETAAGMKKLKSVSSPLGRLVACVIFSAFWNGIVGVFVYQIFNDHSGFSLLMGIFLIPFVLIGLGTIGLAIYLLASLFLPRPSLMISQNIIKPGQQFRLEWAFSGNTERVSKFTVELVGAEEATYRRGTSTSTDRFEFFKREIGSQARGQVGRGSLSAAIPAGAIHSFNSSNNKLIWKLKIHGEIENSPDIKEEYQLIVLPDAG